MPFGSGAKKFERKLAGDLAWGPDVVDDPGAQIRIPLTAIGPPSVGAMAEAAVVSEAGGTPYATPQVRSFTGRTLVLDPTGIRHVDFPRGVTRLNNVHLNFAVRWVELARVVVELIRNPRMNMTQARIVLVPPDAVRFRSAHVEMAAMNGAARVGPEAWMLSLGMSYTADQNVVSAVVHGLTRYAPQLFSGRVDSYTG